MNKVELLAAVKRAVEVAPNVKPMLSNKARFVLYTPDEYKSLEYFTKQVRRLTSSLYNGFIGGEFIDLMANLISGQLFDAYYQAWQSVDGGKEIPEYLNAGWEADVLRQYDFVDQFYRDIVDAKIDKTSLEPLMVRADLWGNRWNESYNNAIALIMANEGGNMVWQYGDTDHCETCRQLDGIVASANDWAASGVKPQSAPNAALECGGWRCQCTLTPTDKRRSPKALDTILNAVVSMGV